MLKILLHELWYLKNTTQHDSTQMPNVIRQRIGTSVVNNIIWYFINVVYIQQNERKQNCLTQQKNDLLKSSLAFK